MCLSEDLVWRGLIKDKTFDDIKWLDRPRKFYLGIDTSSDSLTVGNLAVLMLARRLVDAGWQAVLLAGGATSLVGDPGGKEEERELKSREEIAKNIEGVKTQIEKLFAGQPHEMANNLDWLDQLKLLDFLRDTGKQYPMTELIQREFVDARMGEGGTGISYAEFSYSLLQGYDFWHLFKDRGVEMQIGGSDQWGNMLSGVALIRKKEAKEAQALSMPLVVDKTTGRKFGKSEAGAIWLDSNKTPIPQFYQFWINTNDSDVEEYLKVFTLLAKEEIDQIIELQNKEPSKRLAQIRLADFVTVLVHGEDGLSIARQNRDLFINVNEVIDVSDEVKAELESAGKALKISSGGSIIDALVKTGLAQSNSDARRLLNSDAIYINGQKANRENFEDSDFKNGRLLLRRGKAYKDSALIELE